MPYDPFKDHRRSIRLGGYDYSQAGMYFVTLCTMNRDFIFGDVSGGAMHSNQFGEIVSKWWYELPNYYAPVELDEFVVMPNHINGVIVITDSSGAGPSPANVGAGVSPLGCGESSRPNAGSTPSRLSAKRTLGQLVGYFKFQITKEINQLAHTGYAKVLQRDYYEHIIRSERERDAIADYIRNNPGNWGDDLDNPANFPRHPAPKISDEYWRDVGL
jgi:putative transposase